MARTDSQSGSSALLGLGGLAAIGLVGLGVYATRRRRTMVDYAEPDVIEPIAEPAAEPVGVLDPDYVTYAEAEEPPLVPAVEQQPALPLASAALPDGPVPTGEARQQLLDRMVAAAPDEANPFTSAKGRRRRARLILQAREHELANGSNGFDWRSYQPSSPERVDAPAVETPPERIDA